MAAMPSLFARGGRILALLALGLGAATTARPSRIGGLPRHASVLTHTARAAPTSAPQARSPLEAVREPFVRALASSALVLALTFGGQPAVALDAVSVGTCLLQKCTGELARCIADPTCAANIVCLNLCNGKKDETGCEIKCGDQFANDVIANFNKCAVTNKKCVPQEKDKGEYPVPPAGATVDTFDTRDFTGTWYITAGQNELFDVFPCQKHEFSAPEPGKLVGDLYWRVKTLYGAEVERTAQQVFKADPQHPGILYNHDNEFLHYQDDWYIIGYKPNEYALVYYRGSNDAWDGYGGAVVYTRAKSLPAKYIPELREACAKVPGLDWDSFKKTDNSCKRLKQTALVEQLERDATILRLDLKDLENDVEVGLFGLPTEIGKDFHRIEEEVEREEKLIAKEIEAEGEAFGKEVNAIERFLADKLGIGR